ncbi:hypothetical protein [Hymenobacter cellulosivorans]|uniref:Uncharacterized protein n=1 Tax=Hymenobacter cellulosivorans TaxID=2932249 RepID=A0ABY4F757_9BACT|nr:hypothetical protein [Hymenobacter cellulosivorans]UOQ52051.1 hypothetical protein MUN80_20085 [Hymenobacter cellulosivorans]
MFPTTDYSKMTQEELESEEKKMNSQKTLTALLIGVTVGVAVWSATHHGGILTFGLLGLAVIVGYRASHARKRLQAEISRRDKAPND